jgi:hypothetical protein
MELAGMAEPVRRYLAGSIAPGTPLAKAARLAMRGSIKIGSRWRRFRAREVESPHRGFVWWARVGGFIVGSDRYLDGRGHGLAALGRAQGGRRQRPGCGSQRRRPGGR